jgi:hypothetical protein
VQHRQADKTITAWLLARRRRAENLVRFGSHRSHVLVEMAHDLAGAEGMALAARLSDPDYPNSG